MEEGNVLVGSHHASEIRWLFQAGLLIFTITVAIGILNGFHFITLPRQVLLTHVHAGTLGWITLGVIAICLWLFGEETTTPGNSRPVQALSLLAAIGIPIYVLAFLSGNLLARAIFGFPVLIAIGALLNVQALLGAFIPAELIAVIIYCVRLGPQLRRVNWLAATSERHFGLVVPYLVINLILLIWLITGVVTKAYARFELIPIWLVFAFDPTMFLGVMSNSLFGLIQQASRTSDRFWPFAEQVVFWGMNGGMIGFVLTLATDQRGLEKLFTPIMGGSILIGIITYTVRLQRLRRAAPALTAAPA